MGYAIEHGRLKLLLTRDQPPSGPARTLPLRFYFLVTAVFFVPGCISFSGYHESHAIRAGELRTAGQYDPAIQEYLRHIDERLLASDRPADENPYFYYVLIGDIHLDKGDEAAAKEAYLRAKKEGVENALIADRYRKLAERAEARGDLDRAIDLLREGRELDPQMMDFEIDRLHKRSLELEDRPQSSAPVPSAPLPPEGAPSDPSEWSAGPTAPLPDQQSPAEQ